MGHIAPSSSAAASPNPSVAYRALNFPAAWKKHTTLPCRAYAGMPYHSFGVSCGAAARTAERSASTAATSQRAVANNPVPQSVSGNAVLEIAARYVGVPYVSGGSTPDGFDCSGFTSYVFAQLGISLPRTSSAQRNAGTVVSRADALPGDLIWSPGHVGIYMGNGMMVHAPTFGDVVKVGPVFDGMKARRVLA